ncbi:hypothetical protein ACFX13_025256 [Malus domestica]
MSEKGLLHIFVLLTFLVLIFNVQVGDCKRKANRRGSTFARTQGTRSVMNRKPFYINGFNAYWMMYMASDPSTRAKVTSALQQASKYGTDVTRVWAFSDGGNDRDPFSLLLVHTVRTHV